MTQDRALEGASAAYQRCQLRFPTIDLPIHEFLARAGQSGVPFDQLHHEDLFLATACARGDRIAWEYFTDEFLLFAKRCAAQACRRYGEGEDLAHEIFGTLIADPNKLGQYDGRGSLAGWLRVAIARLAIDFFRRTRREESIDERTEGGDEPAAAATHSGCDFLDSRWNEMLCRVLGEELGRLPARDRLLLSLYYLEEVPLKIIGVQFGVHEATVSRWLDRIRRDIRKQVEKELRKRNLRPREIDSIWRSVAEEGRLSLKEIL